MVAQFVTSQVLSTAVSLYTNPLHVLCVCVCVPQEYVYFEENAFIHADSINVSRMREFLCSHLCSS